MTGLLLILAAVCVQAQSISEAIRDYDQEQAELKKPEQTRKAADFAAWSAERDGVIAAIREAGRKNKPVDKLRNDLVELEQKKPESLKVPKLMRGDDTPENLAWVLAREWPSAGVLSNEAGVVLGAHGMGSDTIMRNLGLLNILWDGGTLSVGRRTSESFTVRGARLTIGLQTQEDVLRSFIEKSGRLARGTGFLARFLLAWPDSTQGSRVFTEASATWPALSAYKRRIAEILANPAPIDNDGALSPIVFTFSPEAKVAWIEYQDAIESQLRSGGELYDVRDVASKSADNAARLAALFQLCEYSGDHVIGFDAFDGASRIAAWHLNESRRFFGELALPLELANAARLDRWMIDYCQRERTHLVPIAKLQQGGPNGLRSKTVIENSMRELENAGRAKWIHDGKRKMIAVNPALLTNEDAL